MKKATLPVAGMMCASCAAHVERCIKQQPGVNDASVNLAARTANIEFNHQQTSPEKIQKAVHNIGYELIIESDRSSEIIEKRNQSLLLRHTILAVIFSLLVMAINMHWLNLGTTDTENQSMLILAACSLIFCGHTFFTSAWRQLTHLSANMDTLVALSTGVSFLFSVFNTFYGDAVWGARGIAWHTNYEATTMITAFVLLGRWLEERAKNSTSAAVRELIQLQPKTARVVKNGNYHDVPLSTLQRGDLIEIRIGERIPVDGTVTEGEGSADQSAMTGEAAPVKLLPGQKTMSGTMLTQGTITIRADRVGQQTQLATMIKAVQEAQGSKAPVQRVVDRVALIFVPTVLILSLLTLGLWLAFGGIGQMSRALMSAVAVLVIACPCAMGLATPTALMVGIGRAARNGILIRDATALEQMKDVSALVIDKTGTLTYSSVIYSLPCKGEARRGPVGAVPSPARGRLAGGPVGAREGTESLREHAAEAIALLQQRGVEVCLMSGDKQSSVAFWADKAGIKHYQAQVLPHHKAERVRQWQSEGRVVAMVGDGVNDSQAMALADVSITMGKATDLALNVAQVTLVHNDLIRIPEAIRLSQLTVRTIRENLFWAFIYNIVCIPLAAGLPVPFGLHWQITPICASALMAFSSVSVVLNSLRLKNIKI